MAKKFFVSLCLDNGNFSALDLFAIDSDSYHLLLSLFMEITEKQKQTRKRLKSVCQCLAGSQSDSLRPDPAVA